jgi:hypothetical protein
MKLPCGNDERELLPLTESCICKGCGRPRYFRGPCEHCGTDYLHGIIFSPNTVRSFDWLDRGFALNLEDIQSWEVYWRPDWRIKTSTDDFMIESAARFVIKGRDNKVLAEYYGLGDLQALDVSDKLYEIIYGWTS